MLNEDLSLIDLGWQKYPSTLDVRDANMKMGTLTGLLQNRGTTT